MMLNKSALQINNSEFKKSTIDSFNRQTVMRTLNAKLIHVDAGEVDIELDYQKQLTQQHGFLHAGIIATVLDSACGYAAFTLMPSEAAVLTIEYKINLLAPAIGDRLICQGKVIRPGQHVTVCYGEAMMVNKDQTKKVAIMTATIMTVLHKNDIKG